MVMCFGVLLVMGCTNPVPTPQKQLLTPFVGAKGAKAYPTPATKRSTPKFLTQETPTPTMQILPTSEVNLLVTTTSISCSVVLSELDLKLLRIQTYLTDMQLDNSLWNSYEYRTEVYATIDAAREMTGRECSWDSDMENLRTEVNYAMEFMEPAFLVQAEETLNDIKGMVEHD
jgi:hypothetical protein